MMSSNNLMSVSQLLPFALFALVVLGCGEDEPLAIDTDFDLTAFADRFEPGSILGAPQIVDCTLSGGGPPYASR